MTQAFDDIDGVAVIVDDILVWGKTMDEHNTRLKHALGRARELNLKLNKEKSEIATNKLWYIGHLLTSDGVKPDPQKVNAIKEINPPRRQERTTEAYGNGKLSCKFHPQTCLTSLSHSENC